MWGYSLGMRQRLQLAAVLLGDPDVLVLDEPANGLDPEGIAWLRSLLRHQADAGRTVLVSSHVLSEVEQTVDDVVIIAQAVGWYVPARLPISCRPIAQLSCARRTPPARLQRWPTQLDVTVEFNPPDGLVVAGATAESVGHTALNERIELHELRVAPTDLEQVYFSLIDSESARPTLAISNDRPHPRGVAQGSLDANVDRTVRRRGCLRTSEPRRSGIQSFDRRLPGGPSQQGVRNVWSSAGTGSLFALVLGILAMTTEFRFKTLSATFLVTPRRSQVIIAKMLALAGVGAILSVTCVVITIHWCSSPPRAEGRSGDPNLDDRRDSARRYCCHCPLRGHRCRHRRTRSQSDRRSHRCPHLGTARRSPYRRLSARRR